jgi:hypothetical protein
MKHAATEASPAFAFQAVTASPIDPGACAPNGRGWLTKLALPMIE